LHPGLNFATNNTRCGQIQEKTALKTLRKSITPALNATWEAVAEAHLPELDRNNAVAQLQSWNLHIFARRVITQDSTDSSHQTSNPILPSDILFLEPPLSQPQDTLG
jgi:hypothetical protein